MIGISGDDVPKQAKFRDKYALNMPLLADTGKEVAAAYGAYKEKNMYGKKVMGIERTTIIVDRHGNVAKIFPRVKVDGHVEQVLDALDRI